MERKTHPLERSAPVFDAEQTGVEHKMRRQRRSVQNTQTTCDAAKPFGWTPLTIGIVVVFAWSVASLFFQDVLPSFVLPMMLFALMVFAAVSSKFNSKKTQNYAAPVATSEDELAERLEALEDQAWEIRESEEIHRSLLEAFGDIVIHRNPQGHITFSNRHFDRYFEGPNALPTVNTIGSWMTGDVPLAAAEDANGAKTRELELETHMGPRWFDWTDLPVRDSETGQTGVRSIARDITERKLQEEALAKARQRAEVANEAKSRFLAMVSHEIRTPLNGVLGMAQLLKRSQLNPTQSSHVDAISKSGKILLTLIEDILDTAQVEAGQLKLAPVRTHLASVIEEVAEILGPRVTDLETGKSLALATYIAPDLPDYVEVDPGRLRQVLLNLAGNAVKFTESGGVGIFVHRNDNASIFPDAVSIGFEVRDSGPGLSADDQAKIFDEFVQSDSSETRAHGGAGLGLAISKRLVELMGGALDVKSTLGQGACFAFSLDLPTDEPFEKYSATELAHKRVVLLAEKSSAADAMQQTLESEGALCQVVSHSNAFSASADDVIIHHRNITESSEALEAAKRVFGSDAKVFLLADDQQREDVDDLLMAGFDGWLIQPLRKPSLLDVLSKREKTDENLADHTTDVKAEQPLQVLLAEDNPINALLVTSLLKRMGHTIEHVENGKMALAAMASKPFDLVLMDLHMPVMGGLEAIERIRTQEADKGGTAVPIIVLSAEGFGEIREKAIAAGANAFALKPLDVETFETLVSQLSLKQVAV